MGFKHDQRLPSEIHEEYLEALNQSQDEQLPPYTETVEDSSFNNHAQSYLHGPNASQSGSASAAPMSLNLRDAIGGGISQESLGPPLPTPSEFNHGYEGDENGGRRVLLLVYIHGFVGDETSFGSFPAHVHGMVTRRLADTHVVYSKVFPKYKTRGNVTTVRDRFSEWLIERQSSRTDVILIGHSMGGIVAAEVALMPGSGRAGLKHKIVGTLNIDVPFLGMHPKVIGAGISSLFAGSPDAKPTGTPGLEGMGGIALMPVEPPGSEASTSTLSLPSSNQSTLSGLTSSLELPSPDDRHFNPVYANDNRVPTRKTFDNIAHFVSKHAMSDGLLKAGTKYVSSHLQFGGTMADYRKLDRRYKQLRALEMDEYGDVRFVNFFTTCHGRPKKVKPTKPAKAEKQPKTKSKAKGKGKGKESGNTEDRVSGTDAVPAEAATTPEDQAEHQSPAEDMEHLSLTVTDPRPVSESSASHSEGESTPGSIEDFEDAQDYLDEGQAGSGTLQVSKEMQAELEAGLPPVPLEPTPVPGFDASKYPDKDSLKLAERLYYRQLKAYQQAFKDRERVIKERNKVIQKRKEKMQKEKEKADQKAEKEALKVAKAKSKETAKEEQKRRAEEKNAEKNAEKEAQKKVKQLEKEALKEKKEAEKAEKARLKEEMKQKKKQQQQAEQEGVDDDDDDEETDESEDEEEEEGEGDLTPLGSLSSDQHLPDSSSSIVEPTIMKAQKLKTFCLTPPKALTARRKDWIPVFVADVDQVGAHCGLFKTDQPHYERFVESVVSKIEEWVQDVDGEIRI